MNFLIIDVDGNVRIDPFYLYWERDDTEARIIKELHSALQKETRATGDAYRRLDNIAKAMRNHGIRFDASTGQILSRLETPVTIKPRDEHLA